MRLPGSEGSVRERADPAPGALEARGARRHRQRRDFRKFRQNVARFRLYRHRFLKENMRFAAFFKI